MKTNEPSNLVLIIVMLTVLVVGVIGVNISREMLDTIMSGLAAWCVVILCIASWLICFCCRIDIFYRLLAALVACSLGGVAGVLIIGTYRLWSAL